MVDHALYGCGHGFVGILALASTASAQMTNAPTTAAAAAKFVEQAEARAAEVNVEQQRASWVAENFILLRAAARVAGDAEQGSELRMVRWILPSLR